MTRIASLPAALVLAALVSSTAIPGAYAADAVPTEKDPVAAERAVKLGEKLRCLVCQNQTIGESNAELAVDLRRQVREQIAAGKTDADIIDYMVKRYGDFVLYEPPVKGTTLLLWGGPGLLLLIGAFTLFRIVRARRRMADDLPLTAEEQQRAERLLAGEPGKELK
jgi:cytochrome c-type biogenesis protein CcmH